MSSLFFALFLGIYSLPLRHAVSMPSPHLFSMTILVAGRAPRAYSIMGDKVTGVAEDCTRYPAGDAEMTQVCQRGYTRRPSAAQKPGARWTIRPLGRYKRRAVTNTLKATWYVG